MYHAHSHSPSSKENAPANVRAVISPRLKPATPTQFSRLLGLSSLILYGHNMAVTIYILASTYFLFTYLQCFPDTFCQDIRTHFSTAAREVTKMAGCWCTVLVRDSREPCRHILSRSYPRIAEAASNISSTPG